MAAAVAARWQAAAQTSFLLAAQAAHAPPVLLLVRMKIAQVPPLQTLSSRLLMKIVATEEVYI